MCLLIANTDKPKPLPKGKKFYKVYKVYDRVNLIASPLFYGNRFNLRKGIELVSNRPSIALNSYEHSTLEVYQGLHFGTTLKVAEQYVKDHCKYCTCVIVEFSGDNADLVAKGDPTKPFHKDTVVFKKATITGITAWFNDSSKGFRVRAETRKIPKEVLKTFNTTKTQVNV